MKPEILVDTSAWIDYFNRPDSWAGGTVEMALKEGRVVTAGIVLTELLQGAKSQGEFDAILEGMAALPILETTHSTWVEAGRISFSLRRKGVTIPTTDLIIASLALEHGCMIFTMDPHFQKMPQVELYEWRNKT